MIQFILANKSSIALALYAVLDVVILINPKIDGYGIIHQLLLVLQKIAGTQPPAIPPQVPPAA